MLHSIAKPRTLHLVGLALLLTACHQPPSNSGPSLPNPHVVVNISPEVPVLKDDVPPIVEDAVVIVRPAPPTPVLPKFGMMIQYRPTSQWFRIHAIRGVSMVDEWRVSEPFEYPASDNGTGIPRVAKNGSIDIKIIDASKAKNGILRFATGQDMDANYYAKEITGKPLNTSVKHISIAESGDGKSIEISYESHVYSIPFSYGL